MKTRNFQVPASAPRIETVPLPLLQRLRSRGISSGAVGTALPTVTFNKTFLYLVTV